MTRRIVTGEKNGRSIILSDGPVPNIHKYVSVPGFQTALAWATPHTPKFPEDSIDTTSNIKSFVPDPYGTRVILVQFPPDSVFESKEFNPEGAGEEYAKHLPGLAESFDADGSGMHRTDTVDYDVIVSGELWLELDDGEVRHLKAGDIVIQNGTRHAWRNRSEQPATMIAVLIGAKR
jgi:mannose-6-phosphate isomerase-like protein (cupin superfamily)